MPFRVSNNDRPHAGNIHREPVHTLSNEDLTRFTIHRMGKLVDDSRNDSLLLDIALQIVPNPSGLTVTEKAELVHRWVRKNVTYQSDGMIAWKWLVEDWDKANDTEVLISPSYLVRMRYPRGDCDDMSMLGKVLLELVGVVSRFVTIKGNPYEPSEWSHVYLMVLSETGELIPMDCSHGGRLGWETPVQWEVKLWD